MNKLKHALAGSTLGLGIIATTALGAGAAQADVTLPNAPVTPHTSPATINLDNVKVPAVKTKTVTKTTEYLNLRESNTTRSKVIKVINKGDKVNVLKSNDGWKKVKVDGDTGWASSYYLKNTKVEDKSVETKYTNTYLNLRDGKSMNSNVIKVMPNGASVEVLGESGGWTKVKIDGDTGWAGSNYLNDSKQSANKELPKTPAVSTSSSTQTSPQGNDAQQNGTQSDVVKKNTSKNTGTKKNTSTNSTSTNVTKKASGTRASVIANAKKHVGAKYRFGGTSPTTGWDCSGYVQHVFKESGMNVPRTHAWAGHKQISQSQAQPGDLVVQHGGSHVGIYAGNGTMYNAANPKTGTVLAPTNYAPATFYKMTK